MDDAAEIRLDENVTSGNAAGTDGEFLLVERLDSNGNITGYDRIPKEEFQTLVAGSISQANEDEVDSSENSLGASEVETPTQIDVLVCCNVILVVTVFACLGALCVRTLVRSFER